MIHQVSQDSDTGRHRAKGQKQRQKRCMYAAQHGTGTWPLIMWVHPIPRLKYSLQFWFLSLIFPLISSLYVQVPNKPLMLNMSKLKCLTFLRACSSNSFSHCLNDTLAFHLLCPKVCASWHAWGSPAHPHVPQSMCLCCVFLLSVSGTSDSSLCLPLWHVSQELNFILDWLTD